MGHSKNTYTKMKKFRLSPPFRTQFSISFHITNTKLTTLSPSSPRTLGMFIVLNNPLKRTPNTYEQFYRYFLFSVFIQFFLAVLKVTPFKFCLGLIFLLLLKGQELGKNCLEGVP